MGHGVVLLGLEVGGQEGLANGCRSNGLVPYSPPWPWQGRKRDYGFLSVVGPPRIREK